SKEFLIATPVAPVSCSIFETGSIASFVVWIHTSNHCKLSSLLSFKTVFSFNRCLISFYNHFYEENLSLLSRCYVDRPLSNRTDYLSVTFTRSFEQLIQGMLLFV